MHRIRLASSTLVAVFLCLRPGAAQTSAPEGDAANAIFETVVISAEKRGVQDAQRVPGSLTIVNDSDIQQRHALNLHDLTTAAPNVTLTEAVPGYAFFSIRGLGINTTIPSMEPAVGVFVDGIYLGLPAGGVPDLVDLESVEILRGPQGLLFGHNTTGGAILLNTRRPGDVFSVSGSVSYETGAQEITSASIEAPMGKQFRAKVTGYYSNDDGWFTNNFDGKSFGASRNYLVRPIVVWTPTAALDSTLIYERSSRRGDGVVLQNSVNFSGFHIGLNDPEFERFNAESLTSETNWRIGNGMVTNLAGYRRFDQELAIDNDGAPFSGFGLATLLKQHQFSEELRYFGRLFDKVDLTTGIYYFRQSYSYLERRRLPSSGIDSTLGAAVTVTDHAVFAQADYHATSQLTLIAGGRYTGDDKDAKIATFVLSTAGSRCNYATQSCVYNFPGPTFPNAPGKKTWNSFTPKLGAEWQDDDLLIYGHWSQGVRSGGYNVRNTSVSVPPGPYDPELQNAFELGVKSSWFDNRLHANAALFYDEIKKMQRDVNQIDSVSAAVQVTRNTADATIKGVELELVGALTSELVLHANAGYTNGKYDKIFFDLDGGGIGPSDYRLAIPRLVPWSYAFGATYTHNVAVDMQLRVRADYGFRSRAASTDSNVTFLPEVKELSASVGLALPGNHWTISLYGRNLLNVVSYGVNAALPAFLGGGTLRTLNEGRVIGVEANFTY